MTSSRSLYFALALALAACSTNNTGTVSSLQTGDDRFAADKSPATLVRVGDATRAGGDPASAVGLYRRAHDLAPQDPAPLSKMGAALVELHAYTEAAEAYSQAVALAPNDAEIRRGFGALLVSIDKPDLALTQLEAALALRKEPRTYNLIGVANDLVGHHDVAQQNYAEGLRLAPENLALRNNLGLSQALARDFLGAIATLSAAAANPKATPRTRQNLALVFGLAGETERAAAVARTDLDEASVKSNLSYYAMLRGMDDRARAAAIIGGRVPTHPTEPETAALDQPQAVEPKVAVEKAPLPAPASTAENRPVVATPTVAAVQPPAKRPPRAPVRSPEPAKIEPAVAEPPQLDPSKSGPSKGELSKSDPSKSEPSKAEPSEAKLPEAPAQPQAAAEPEMPAAPEPLPAKAAPVATVDDAKPAARPEREAAEAKAEPVAADAKAEPAAAEAKVAPTVSEPPHVAAETAALPAAQPSRPARLAAAARPGRFLVQVGAFRDPVRAHKLCDELAAKGYAMTVSEATGDAAKTWYFCRSSTAADHASAAASAETLRTSENAPALLIPASLQ